MFNITGNQAFDYYIVESDTKRQKLENLFEQAIRQGYDPNDIQDEIYRQVGFGPNELLDTDRQTLQRKVETWFRQYNR